MSDIVAATRTHLLAQSGVTDLVSTRIYYNNLPQNATLPAIVVELVGSEVMDRHLSATGALYRAQVNVYCYASTHSVVAAVGAAVYAAMEFITGTWGSVTVKLSLVEHEHDLTVPPRDASENYQQMRALMCAVLHN